MVENSGAPVEGEVTDEQREHSLKDMMQNKAAHDSFKPEEVEVKPDDGFVSFVAAAEFNDCKFLVKEGKVVEHRNDTNRPGMRGREGVKKARFTNGVLATDDPEVIAWCDAHTTICRRASDPMTKGWASMKDMNVKKANRERLQDPSALDADAAFPPGSEMLDRLREQAAKDSSVGGELVRSAELTKQSMEQNK